MGRIPAVSRERRQPGRRVLLDWFYIGLSSLPVHLYLSLELAMTTHVQSLPDHVPVRISKDGIKTATITFIY